MYTKFNRNCVITQKWIDVKNKGICHSLFLALVLASIRSHHFCCTIINQLSMGLDQEIARKSIIGAERNENSTKKKKMMYKLIFDEVRSNKPIYVFYIEIKTE